ncbi:MAG: BlaI/MecI/CopY family transcriptional regulator [Propionibacteriaceae bacterium]|nr:BlaI/MecI/CopY family transcriptional regulator [Propionibacteriaceae bacterium]
MASRGELEQRIMELLWAADEPRSVADVHQELGKERELAYTTVMTVLDRLAKKHLASRELVNRAWQYQAADPQHIVVARELKALLDSLPDDVRRLAIAAFAAQLSDDERKLLAG